MAIPANTKLSAALAKDERWQGVLAVKNMTRVTPELAGTEGDLDVDLEVHRGLAGDSMRGSVRGDIRLVCRSCQQPFDHRLDLRIDLALVRSEEEEARVLQDREPYLVIDDRLPLHELVEDEVVLALPMMPRCETCENAVIGAVPEQREGEQRPNPFAQLKKLKF